MIARSLHPWNVSYKEAIQIQNRLKKQLVLDLPFATPKTVGGVDVSVSIRSCHGWAGVVVLSFPDLEVVEESWAKGKIDFPYIPGLLSFREIPLILDALKDLSAEPDVFLCDGQGIAHPRRMGLASHLGVLLGKPTIGCAKSRLVGHYHEVGPMKGDYSLLTDKGETIGAALRTRSGTKPIFVSPGYGLSIRKAIEVALCCCMKYRIPEPIRAAHRLVNQLRRAQKDG
ncbi:MAG: deoxyribonuclease V [Deltaproteobacteria bacterium]|nr:MAG: deoxyribonuclease V [Deltaproteobacteria bacterium]